MGPVPVCLGVGLPGICGGQGGAESRCSPGVLGLDSDLGGAGPLSLPRPCPAAVSVFPLVCVLWCPLPVPLWEGQPPWAMSGDLQLGGPGSATSPQGMSPLWSLEF